MAPGWAALKVVAVIEARGGGGGRYITWTEGEVVLTWNRLMGFTSGDPDSGSATLVDYEVSIYMPGGGWVVAGGR